MSPRIRFHRYERILAVKWSGDEHWLMIWPTPGPESTPAGEPAAQTERNPLVSGAGLDGPEWIAPTADHHRDLTALTAPVRGELARAVRRVNATLGMIGKHSHNGWPAPGLPQE